MDGNILSINRSKKNDKRFLILVIAVSVSGFSQGLLLPLLSVLLEKQGVSSSLNGLSAAFLYLGMLIASPFLERPVRRFGYKPVILFGLILISVAMLMFPLWTNFYFWIILRFFVGIGDTALHFATQVWITSTVEASKRGRSISLYGLAYGAGFGIGPLGLMLLPLGKWVPFLTAELFILLVIFLIYRLENDKPVTEDDAKTEKRYLRVYAIAGIALMPMFIYGLLEATLNNSFPIYGLRTGIEEAKVSLLLSSFVIGSLVFQLPLGILSDKIGRRRILILTTFLGGIVFLLVPYSNTTAQMFVLFILAGSFVGSIYSLGLAYVADLVPPSLLPTANIIAGIHFGIGSMLGPYIGGSLMSSVSPESLFYFISISILSFSMIAGIETVSKMLKQTVDKV